MMLIRGREATSFLCSTGILASALTLLLRHPRQKQSVRSHIFPVRNRTALDPPAMPRQKTLQLLSPEPLLPLGRLQSAPLLDILIDDHNSAAQLDHPAHFRDRGVDIHG